MSFLTSLDTAGELERRQDSTGGVQSSTAKGQKDRKKKEKKKCRKTKREKEDHSVMTSCIRLSNLLSLTVLDRVDGGKQRKRGVSRTDLVSFINLMIDGSSLLRFCPSFNEKVTHSRMLMLFVLSDRYC